MVSHNEKKAIEKQNLKWLTRKKANRLDKRSHPWYLTDANIKQKKQKIWTDDITPENKDYPSLPQ